MRPMVVDASAALAYVLGEVGAQRAEGLIAERDVILVPWLFWPEVINSLARRHRWPGSQVLSAVYDLEQLGLDTQSPARPFMLAVIDAVEAHGISAYDAEYLVLAEAADGDLLTGDRQLASAAGSRAIRIDAGHRLAEDAAAYAPPPHSGSPDWPRWPGAVHYLEELRRETQAQVEASRP